MAEWEDGSSNLGSTNSERRQSIIDAFQISADEEAELDWLKDKYQEARSNGVEEKYVKVFDNVLLICEDEQIAGRLGYETQQQITSRLVEATQPRT